MFKLGNSILLHCKETSLGFGYQLHHLSIELNVLSVFPLTEPLVPVGTKNITSYLEGLVVTPLSSLSGDQKTHLKMMLIVSDTKFFKSIPLNHILLIY